MNAIGPYYAQDSNYYQTPDELVRSFNEYMSEDLGVTFRLPTHKVVCPQCGGDGMMVNRSIDGQGLDPNDPDLDKDFWEDYLSGRYDVRCDECYGNNVVDEVDEARLPEDILVQWHSWCESSYDMVQEQLAELRFGC